MTKRKNELLASAIGFIVLVGTGCAAVTPLSVIGDQCDKASDCEAPLICGLGRCRRECEATRDCALGLRCIKLPAPSEIGVCQLPEEANCSSDADCPDGLTCFVGEGGCLRPCSETDPCISGEMCSEASKCEPLSGATLCVYDSECDYPLICLNQTCSIECSRGLTDCRVGTFCVQDDSESCADGPCMCRIGCDLSAPDTCPPGTECTPCGDGLDCSETGTNAYCERPGAGDEET
jgi:hypothetical protein